MAALKKSGSDETPYVYGVAIVLCLMLSITLSVSGYYAYLIYQTECRRNQDVLVPFASNIIAEGHPMPETLKTFADEKEALTFEDMYDGTLRPKSPYATWIGHTNKLHYYDSDYNLVITDLDTNNTEIAINASVLAPYNVGQLFFSPDEKFVLFAVDQIDEIQTATLWARFKIYDREKEEVLDFPKDDAMKTEILLYAGWAGSEEVLTFNYDDDLYYQKTPCDAPVRLTTSGSTHKIRNGLSFWNYYGVLWELPLHWFSPDMKYLSYGQFNSTEVPISGHPIYGLFENVYTVIYEQVYLKAGDAINHSWVNLFVRNMDTGTEIEILRPEEFADNQYYLYSVKWTDDTHMVVAWCNREQNHSIVNHCSVPDGNCVRITETKVPGGWLRQPPISRLISNNTAALGVHPRDHGEAGSYQQVAVLTLTGDNAGNLTFLTSATREVFYIAGYDEERHLVYYQASGDNPDEMGQLTNHIYRVGTSEADAELQAEACMTCDAPNSDECQYFSSYFSHSSANVIVTCQGPGIPKTYLRWTADDNDGPTLVLQDNQALRDIMATKDVPKREYHKIDVDDGFDGWVELTIPNDIDTTKKYPLLLYPYAGPHGHTQADYAYKANYGTGGGWENYLASSEGVVVARINGRGTGARGDKYLFEVYHKLGQPEIQDQIAGAQSIIDKLGYIDPDRVAVWGWSYGGFTTSHVIGDPTKVINCGLAVAPVTSFRWYYSGYTEAFMGLDTPEDNQAGYDLTDVTLKAAHFKDKNYFLAHGTLDDNVHFQHAAMLTKALAEEEVQFKVHMYVDENHGIRDYYQNRQLFRAMTDFIKGQCFNLE